jgi:hypothetical protein
MPPKLLFRRCPSTLVGTVAALAICSLASLQTFGQDAEIKELCDAIGEDGFAHNASQDRHICVQIHHHPDQALRALVRTSPAARSSVKRILIRDLCTNPESFRLIGQFESLDHLDVCENAWASTISQVVGKSTTITNVWAEGAGIDGDDLRAISKAKQLRVLMIGRNRFKGSDLACLANLVELTQLSLGGNEMTTKDLEFVRKLENLRWLELIDTQLDDGIIPIVSNCKKLKILSLGKNKLTPEGRVKLGDALPSTLISLESPSDE